MTKIIKLTNLDNSVLQIIENAKDYWTGSTNSKTVVAIIYKYKEQEDEINLLRAELTKYKKGYKDLTTAVIDYKQSQLDLKVLFSDVIGLAEEELVPLE